VSGVIQGVKRVLSRLLEWLVILLVAALVLDVLWGVFSRFVLASPSRWTEEAATILLIWVSLLGAAVGFERNEHLGVDYLVTKLDPAARRLTRVVAQLLVMWFAAAAMVYGGYVLVSKALASGQVSPALGIRFGYVYLAVPLSGAFIVLFALEQALRAALGLEPVPDDVAADPCDAASID
jgi:TRAP-type C4-dicarboxylate transport system permease small subunit